MRLLSCLRSPLDHSDELVTRRLTVVPPVGPRAGPDVASVLCYVLGGDGETEAGAGARA